jgi:hypothetical protein
MGCLVAMTGVSAAFWLLIILAMWETASEAGTLSIMLFIEAVVVLWFLVFLNKYRSPEYQAKQKKAQEDWAAYKAAAPERKRQMNERMEQEAERRRRATTVVSTRLLGETAPEYKKGVGNVAVRGAVGSLFGPAGAVIGMATAKNKNVNKGKRRFLVKYEDGHIEERVVTTSDPLYKVYMEHLEWE